MLIFISLYDPWFGSLCGGKDTAAVKSWWKEGEKVGRTHNFLWAEWMYIVQTWFVWLNIWTWMISVWYAYYKTSFAHSTLVVSWGATEWQIQSLLVWSWSTHADHSSSGHGYICNIATARGICSLQWPPIVFNTVRCSLPHPTRRSIQTPIHL